MERRIITHPIPLMTARFKVYGCNCLPQLMSSAELTGIDNYMEPKIKAAQLIEPGSAHMISAIGDEIKTYQ